MDEIDETRPNAQQKHERHPRLPWQERDSLRLLSLSKVVAIRGVDARAVHAWLDQELIASIDGATRRARRIPLVAIEAFTSGSPRTPGQD